MVINCLIGLHKPMTLSQHNLLDLNIVILPYWDYLLKKTMIQSLLLNFFDFSCSKANCPQICVKKFRSVLTFAVKTILIDLISSDFAVNIH